MFTKSFREALANAVRVLRATEKDDYIAFLHHKMTFDGQALTRLSKQFEHLHNTILEHLDDNRNPLVEWVGVDELAHLVRSAGGAWMNEIQRADLATAALRSLRGLAPDLEFYIFERTELHALLRKAADDGVSNEDAFDEEDHTDQNDSLVGSILDGADDHRFCAEEVPAGAVRAQVANTDNDNEAPLLAEIQDLKQQLKEAEELHEKDIGRMLEVLPAFPEKVKDLEYANTAARTDYHLRRARAALKNLLDLHKPGGLPYLAAEAAIIAEDGNGPIPMARDVLKELEAK